MPKVEFVGQSARDSGNAAANPSRLVNLYREPVVSQGRTGYILRSVPGLEPFADVARTFLRAMEEIGSVVYAVAGGRLFRITATGVTTELGVILDDANTTIAHNNGRVSIVAAGLYYVWDGTSLTTVAPSAVTNAGSCAYLGGYTVVSQLNGRLAQWSQLVNAQTLPPANVRASETTDENIIRVMTINERLVVFKQNSHEQWQVTGQANERAISLIVGSNVETGLLDFNLVTLHPNGAAFVGSDGKFHVFSGGQTQPISIPAVEATLDIARPQRCFYYERRGHGFLCITFRDAPAWCYDIATGEWHERAEGVTFGAWTAQASVKIGATWLIGYANGRIGKVSALPVEFGAAIRRTAVSRTLWVGERFTVPLLQLFAHIGFGENVANHEAALIMARFSRDGLTWGMEKVRSFGEKGRFDHMMTFRALGQFRNMTMELAMTDNVDLPIYADCNLVVT
jgi:hypothetical protein